MPETKVVFRDNDNVEFFVFANEGMISKWKSDKTIPLDEVVVSFDIFTTNTGNSIGEVIRPPWGMLETSFRTEYLNEMVERILEEGEEKKT